MAEFKTLEYQPPKDNDSDGNIPAKWIKSLPAKQADKMVKMGRWKYAAKATPIITDKK